MEFPKHFLPEHKASNQDADGFGASQLDMHSFAALAASADLGVTAAVGNLAVQRPRRQP